MKTYEVRTVQKQSTRTLTQQLQEWNNKLRELENGPTMTGIVEQEKKRKESVG